jgi:hypothetical protein
VTPSPIKILLASEDLSHGQIVMIAARWIFVATGLFLALLAPGDLVALRFQILVLLVLAVVNFYLYTQVVMRRPALQVVIYVTSLADLMTITFLTLFSPQGAFFSYLYVFYFPALLVISVTFAPKMLAIFASAIPLYGLVALTTGGGIPFEDVPTVVIRMLMLGAIVICGSSYGDIERRRRRGAVQPVEFAHVPGPAEPGLTPPQPATQQPTAVS